MSAPGQAPTVRTLTVLARSIWRAGPWRVAAGFGSEIIVGLGMVAAIYGSKIVVDGALEGDRSRALTGAVVMAVAVAARQICSWANTITDLGERTAQVLERHLIDLSARLPGVEHHEQPELLDQLQIVREQRSFLGQIVHVLSGNIATWVAGTISVGLLLSLHPAMVLVLLGGLASLAGAFRTERLRSAAQQVVAEDHRLTIRLEEVARDPRVGGELRLQRLAPLLLRRHAEAGRRVIDVETPGELRALGWDLLGVTAMSAAQVVAIGYAAHLGTSGRLSAGDVVMALGLVQRATSQLNAVIDGFGSLLRAMRVVRRLAWLEAEVADAEERIGGDAELVPARLTSGIRFEGVGFAYPGSGTDALQGVDLELPAGSSIALVGENGAGKSTLVKLLLRLYEPTSGRILVDGTELAAMDPTAWRARLSGAFQDPARLELVAREVVGVGDLPRIEDVDAVEAAVGAAGAESTVAGLPAGLATPVGPSFDDGVELSGGQWQLLALARAMMRRRPLLLVLDEPTAALDPGREHALFERYAEAARLAAAETGGVTVLVSHRFSTVRMADHIAVVDGGRVVEHGTHDELMAVGGLYAELFTLQARAYS